MKIKTNGGGIFYINKRHIISLIGNTLKLIDGTYLYLREEYIPRVRNYLENDDEKNTD